MASNPFPNVPGTTALVLAAGASQRMGVPKPLLRTHGVPLVQHMVAVLQAGGVEKVVVVTNRTLLSVIDSRFSGTARVHVMANLHPEAGMLSTVQVGMDAIWKTSDTGEAQALLVCPIDLPLLTPNAVYAILKHWTGKNEKDCNKILVPIYSGKRGHPTLFSESCFSAIRALDSRQYGLNELLKRHYQDVEEISVDDPGVVQDTDTPEEWRRWLGEEPSLAVTDREGEQGEENDQ